MPIYRAHKGEMGASLERLSQLSLYCTSHFPQIGIKLLPGEKAAQNEERRFFAEIPYNKKIAFFSTAQWVFWRAKCTLQNLEFEAK